MDQEPTPCGTARRNFRVSVSQADSCPKSRLVEEYMSLKSEMSSRLELQEPTRPELCLLVTKTSSRLCPEELTQENCGFELIEGSS